MGQENSSLRKIRELTSAATVTRHAAGEKVLIAHNNQAEYVLITKLFTGKQADLEGIIGKRKQLRGPFIAELMCTPLLK